IRGIDPEVERIESATLALAQAATDRRRVIAVENIRSAVDAFLPQMERLVESYVASAERRVTGSQMIFMTLGLTMVALLVLQVFFIFRPVRVTLANLLRDQRRETQAAQQSAKELRQLAQERDDDLESIRAAHKELERAYTQLEQAHAETQQSHKSLNEAQTRYALAVEGTNDGIWDWDLRQDRLYLSRNYHTQLGYEVGELECTFAKWREMVHPDDTDAAVAAVERHLADDGPYDVIFRIRHKDGSWRHMQSRGKCSRDEEGNPLRFVGAHIDVTERIQNA
ncbi:MAG: PAS domain-containing protein, partial [Planctomycetota bacterium]